MKQYLHKKTSSPDAFNPQYSGNFALHRVISAYNNLSRQQSNQLHEAYFFTI